MNLYTKFFNRYYFIYSYLLHIMYILCIFAFVLCAYEMHQIDKKKKKKNENLIKLQYTMH